MWIAGTNLYLSKRKGIKSKQGYSSTQNVWETKSNETKKKIMIQDVEVHVLINGTTRPV